MNWTDDDDVDDPDLPDEDDSDDEEVETRPCPSCGKQVYEDSEQCPHCGNYITWSTSAWSDRPWWWVALGLLGAAAMLWAMIVAF